VNAPHQIFGKNVLKLRMKKGMTQETLAERAEISHRYLQSIEAGTKQPSINVGSSGFIMGKG
jgi:transcriptional regulator with XRE-family HTH domain